MQRIMKSSTVKTVIVNLNKKMHEVAIDSDLFDDIYVEAATRVIEQYKGNETFFAKMDVIAMCFEKKDAKKPAGHFAVNMYHTLTNAGMHGLADLMRSKVKIKHNVDMRLEPIRALGTNGKPAN